MSERKMVVTLSPHLEAVLAARAKHRGVSPEVLAVESVAAATAPVTLLEPQDEWERRLFSAAVDCGVSLSDRAVSSEGMCD